VRLVASGMPSLVTRASLLLLCLDILVSDVLPLALRPGQQAVNHMWLAVLSHTPRLWLSQILSILPLKNLNNVQYLVDSKSAAVGWGRAYIS